MKTNIKLPLDQEQAIDAAPDAEGKNQRLDAAKQARLDLLEKAFSILSGLGVTLDNILNGEFELHCNGEKLIENVISGYSVEERKALKLCRGGQRTVKEVARQSGLPEARVREIYTAFYNDTREKMRAKVAALPSGQKLKIDSDDEFRLT